MKEKYDASQHKLTKGDEARLLILLIILAIIAFIAFLKATVIISYADEVELAVKVLFFKIKILPSKKKRGRSRMSAKKAQKIREKMRSKAEKKRLSKETKEKEKAAKKASGEKKSVAETIANVKMLSSVAVAVIETFFKRLRIRVARIKIKVATGDAATTAIAYGAITQSLNILLPLLESVKNFEKLDKTDIDVSADFLEESPTIDVKLAFSIRVWHVFDVAFAALGRFLKHKLKADASSAAPSHNHKFNNESKNKK